MPVKLPNVTLVAVNGADHKNRDWINLFKFCHSKVEPEESLLFTHCPESYTDDLFATRVWPKPIPTLDHIEFAEFSLYEMYKDIETDYVICIQLDGFVVNEDAWDPKFLDFDYIGAPWPYDNLAWQYQNFPDRKPAEIGDNLLKYNVGNGGFCLKSLKFMEEVAKIPYWEMDIHANDIATSLTHRKRLEDAGVKFADPQTAIEFSVESKHVENCVTPEKSFGFHCRNTHPDKVRLLEEFRNNENE